MLANHEDGLNSFLYTKELTPTIRSLPNLVVEDDEDDFPTVRPDGDFVHNSNSSKEKRKYVAVFSVMKIRMNGMVISWFKAGFYALF